MAKLGEKLSEATKKKMSQSKLAEKNPKWKGDKVGYKELHKWVRIRKPRPKICPRCVIRKTHDLANKGVYNRELKNWEWLCRKCHMEKDGRLKIFLNSKRNLGKRKKDYKVKKVTTK